MLTAFSSSPKEDLCYFCNQRLGERWLDPLGSPGLLLSMQHTVQGKEVGTIISGPHLGFPQNPSRGSQLQCVWLDYGVGLLRGTGANSIPPVSWKTAPLCPVSQLSHTLFIFILIEQKSLR